MDTKEEEQLSPWVKEQLEILYRTDPEYAEKKRREAQEKLRKENAKIIKQLHNEGRLKYTTLEALKLSSIILQKGKFCMSRPVLLEK